MTEAIGLGMFGLVGEDAKTIGPFPPDLHQSQIRSAHFLVANSRRRTFDVIEHCPIGRGRPSVGGSTPDQIPYVVTASAFLT